MDIVIREVDRKRMRGWPEYRTVFAGTVTYEVETEGEEEPATVYVKYEFKEKYGRKRRHITVYKKKSEPLASFLGTDRYSISGRVMYPLRENEGRALIRDLKDLPPDYRDYEPVRYRRHIEGSGAPYCWGLLIKENPEELIELGLAREAATA
ncbi:MAG: hypothetical protein WC314_00175 [Vulcanimicrobiota bacterium]